MNTSSLINGEIVNEFDEVVGTYRYIIGNRYWLTLYGNKYEVTRKELEKKINELELYFVPDWN